MQKQHTPAETVSEGNCERGELGSTWKQDSRGSGCFPGFKDKELCLHHCIQIPKVEWRASPSLSKTKKQKKPPPRMTFPNLVLSLCTGLQFSLSLSSSTIGCTGWLKWELSSYKGGVHQAGDLKCIKGLLSQASDQSQGVLVCKTPFQEKSACQEQVDENWLRWIKGNFCSKFWMGDEDIGCLSISLKWHPTLVSQPLLSIHLLESITWRVSMACPVWPTEKLFEPQKMCLFS